MVPFKAFRFALVLALSVSLAIHAQDTCRMDPGVRHNYCGRSKKSPDFLSEIYYILCEGRIKALEAFIS